MICQVFVPCYFGNEIILKHESITGSIFKCGWHFRDIRFRRIVIIFMEIVTKKRCILVGNWKILDLNLFVSVTPRPGWKVGNLFTNMKEKVRVAQNSMVVYDISREGCHGQKGYLGETTWNLENRSFFS
ncbi:hypothetical protein HA402_005946 [Bradysia odoriphaga]|nr:hypothetical protein HA402_005946 [Bradysia odoriphaga]